MIRTTLLVILLALSVQAQVVELFPRDDFSVVKEDGMASYQLGSIASINPRNWGEKWGGAKTTFQGESGMWQVALLAVQEPDGDTPYRFYINGVMAAEYTNPRIPASSNNQDHEVVFGVYQIETGDELRIDSRCTSNGQVGNEYARARWKKLILSSAATSLLRPAASPSAPAPSGGAGFLLNGKAHRSRKAAAQLIVETSAGSTKKRIQHSSFSVPLKDAR